MTCVVGVKSNGYIYIGADSLGSDSFTGTKIKYPRKVLQVGDFIIGVCGSFRLLQILAHRFAVAPRYIDQDIYDYVYNTFYEHLLVTLRSEKFLTDINNVEYIPNSQLIIGIEDKLFCVQGDLSIIESNEDFISIGSGEYHSSGVLESLRDSKITPVEKIALAIKSTSKHVLSVNEDIYIMTNDEGGEVAEGFRDLDDEDEDGVEELLKNEDETTSDVEDKVLNKDSDVDGLEKKVQDLLSELLKRK